MTTPHAGNGLNSSSNAHRSKNTPGLHVDRHVKTSSGPMQLVVQSDAMGFHLLSRKLLRLWNLNIFSYQLRLSIFLGFPLFATLTERHKI